MSPRLYRGGLQWFEDPSNQPLCMEGNLTCESWSECSHGRSRKFCLCSVLGAAACWFRKASNTSPFSGSVLLLSPQKERPESPRAAVGDRKLSLKTTQKGPGENHSKALSAPPDTGFTSRTGARFSFCYRSVANNPHMAQAAFLIDV